MALSAADQAKEDQKKWEEVWILIEHFLKKKNRKLKKIKIFIFIQNRTFLKK